MKLAVALCLLLAGSALADPELRARLGDQNVVGQNRWIYNNLPKAFAEAKSTGKPLFVTFRCVPCKDCMEFDSLVAGDNAKLQALLDKFVCVRQVEMKGVDLTQFQFDYDLNWAGMFLNGKGSVYARYGTQSSEGADAYNSVESLARTMQRVLALHEDYPANKAQLEGKRGPKRSARSALDLPGLPNKEKFRGQTQRNNCIHCHNIHDAEAFAAWDEGTYSHELLWRYPLPQNIGLEIDRRDGRRIKKVAPDSAFAKMEVPAGSTVTQVDGQAITSIADIQWALHNLARDRNSVEVVVEAPDGKSRSCIVPLEDGWRRTDISWRGSMWSLPPRLRIWLPAADAKERARHKLPAGRRAVVARWINTKEKAGQAAHEAGLRTGDLIIEIDGKPVPAGPDGKNFSLFVKLNYKPGQKLPLTLWRNGKRVQIELPLMK